MKIETTSFAVLAVLLLSGCPNESGTGGAGGAAASSSSSGGTKCTSTDVSACPSPANDCNEASCNTDGTCAERPKAAHAVCASAPGAGVCDGSAVCIGCVDATDCPKAGGVDQLCIEKECVAQCVNGMCDAGKYCDTTNNACVPVDPQGAACTEDGHCATGHCVDGLCCDSACDAPCDACSAALTGLADGTCGAESCTGSPLGATCQKSTTGKCGCSEANEAVDCADVPGKPHCALAAAMVYTCQECFSNAHCATNAKGQSCGAATQNVCGCSANFDCIGIGTGVCNLATKTCM